MSKQMKLIMESWRKNLLEFQKDKAGWWLQNDSDQSGGVLFFMNEKYIKVPYPKPEGTNHGLVSHAIKHAEEFIDLKQDYEKFKQALKARAEGEGLYVRTKITKKGNYYTFKVDKEIIEIIKKFIKVSQLKSDDPKKRPALKNLRTQLVTKTGFNDAKPDQLIDMYKKVFLEIKNPSKPSFIATLDFHHDLDDLKAVDFFDGNLVEKYKKVAEEWINNNEDNFKTSQYDSNKKAFLDKGVAAITYGDGTSTFYKPDPNQIDSTEDLLKPPKNKKGKK
tara:strand:+ start:298 stop:1128 length:831 start_codon:yes stop_codon:yes gene_type:complete